MLPNWLRLGMDQSQGTLHDFDVKLYEAHQCVFLNMHLEFIRQRACFDERFGVAGNPLSVQSP